MCWLKWQRYVHLICQYFSCQGAILINISLEFVALTFALTSLLFGLFVATSNYIVAAKEQEEALAKSVQRKKQQKDVE